VVNLLVTPEQAELLSLASNQTKIQLVLRNPLDVQTSQSKTVAMSNLFTDKAPAPVHSPHAPAAQVFLVEVMNGSKTTEQKFSSGEAK